MMVRKLLYIFMLFLIVVSVSGCAKKYYFEHSFDGYNISLKTYEVFDYQKMTDIDRSQNIQAIAKQRNQTGYIDSIIISEIDLSQVSLDKFMTLNRSTLKSNFVGYKQTKYSDFSFDCKGKEIQGNLFGFRFDMDDKKIYFSQYVFSRDNSGYLVSLSTEDSGQSKIFRKYIKKINCD